MVHRPESPHQTPSSWLESVVTLATRLSPPRLVTLRPRSLSYVCSRLFVVGNKIVHVDVYPQPLGQHRVENRFEFKLVHDIDESRVCLEGQFLGPRTMPQASEEDVLGLIPELLPGVAEPDVASPETWIGSACRAVECLLKGRLCRMHVSSL